MERTHLSESTTQAEPVISGQPDRLRVLVVEDYADAADSLALLLRLWGHEAHVCRTGPEALEVALATLPGAALVDLLLPGMDGCQLARRFREHQALQEVVLIAVTGLGDQEHRRSSQAAGFARYLLKPVDPNELQSILTTLAQRQAT
jgi:CheY-like chemotaxis protein